MVSDSSDTIVSAYASDTDDDCSLFGLNARRPRSRHSVASSRISQASHHSEAMQLASTLADALKEQLKQASERQQLLDRERAAASERQQKEMEQQHQERQDALAREQAILAREERERLLLMTHKFFLFLCT